MHLLDRASVPAPGCLAAYDPSVHKWSHVNAACKRNVRDALEEMQGIPSSLVSSGAVPTHVRCAYCEGAIYAGGHIEHFRRKSATHRNGRPDLTFTWENLFLSCDSADHCGHYKDRNEAPPYKADDLIKPDDEDPEHFLYFHSTGQVRVRSGLAPTDTHRASETIRVFAIDNRALEALRARAVQSYMKRLGDDFDDLVTWEPELRELYLSEELEKTRWDPYATTIKHFLENNLS